MSRFLAVGILATALAGGVVLAGGSAPIQIENETTRTITESGQTFDITAVGITVEVQFTEVTAEHAIGTVRRTGGGTSGTFRILWREAGSTQELTLSISETEKEFSLEGGDTDKRTTQQRN